MNKNIIKDRMFQCTVDNYGQVDILDDTGLITKDEAYKLWNSYFEQIKRALEEGKEADMVIWKDCVSETDYGIEEKVIDHEECIVENGHIYKVTRTEITP